MPASDTCARGPGTLVSTPTALFAKKLVRNTPICSGVSEITRCAPNVMTASCESLIRPIRRWTSASRSTGSSIDKGISKATRAKWLPSSSGMPGSKGRRLTGIIHITSSTEVPCSAR